MSHGHFRTECKECGKLMGTCRCMSKDKETRYDTCQQCKDAVFEKLKENKDG